MSENIKARFKDIADTEILTSATCRPAGGHPSRSFVKICMYGDGIGIVGYESRVRDTEQGLVVHELMCIIEDSFYRNDYDEMVVLVLPEPIPYDDDFVMDPALFIELLMTHPEWPGIVRFCLGALLTDYFNFEY